MPEGVPAVDVVCGPLAPPPPPQPAEMNVIARHRAGMLNSACTRRTLLAPDAPAIDRRIAIKPSANRGNGRILRIKARELPPGITRKIEPAELALPAVVATPTLNPTGEAPVIFTAGCEIEHFATSVAPDHDKFTAPANPPSGDTCKL